MAYREVDMLEVKEVVRLWLSGLGKKAIARQLGRDIKTVRGYLKRAEDAGAKPGTTTEVSDALLATIVSGTRENVGREHGEGWQRCEAHREFIEQHIKNRVRLSKVRRLLVRNGVLVSYATLRRYAMEVLGWGEGQSAIPVDDGKPGEELQVDIGRMMLLEPNIMGKRRLVKAFIFTPNVSRYRFIYPCFTETTKDAILACEAAWEFYGGVFKVLVPDNTKAIVQKADPYHPILNTTFLEYAQARDFHIDTARIRRPRDKGRVEKSVRDTQDDCFGGERFAVLFDATAHAERYCRNEYGMRRHSTTQRLPHEHFEASEKPCLLPAPTGAYDTPLWGDCKIHRDQHAQVARALYSLPRHYMGKTLRYRVDAQTARFYDDATLIRTAPKQPPGGRYTHPDDFPPERLAYAKRDTAYLVRRAKEHGPAVGQMAEKMLDCPLPWTRMRHVYRLNRLGEKFPQHINAVCITALSVELYDVYKLERMLKLAQPPPRNEPQAKVIPLARYLRPTTQLPLALLATTGDTTK